MTVLMGKPNAPKSIGFVLFLCSPNSMLKVRGQLHLSHALFQIFTSFLARRVAVQEYVEVRFEEDSAIVSTAS